MQSVGRRLRRDFQTKARHIGLDLLSVVIMPDTTQALTRNPLSRSERGDSRCMWVVAHLREGRLEALLEGMNLAVQRFRPARCGNQPL